MSPMIHIRQLKFSYPHSSFDLYVPELKIESPCSAAIVGPSGSGKTTLLHLMAGILTPSEGRIAVDDQQIVSMSDAARRQFRLRRVGMVFQNFELIEYLSVLDNVLLPCRIGNAISLTSQIRERAESLLASAGLKPHVKKSVTKLSQGERQRVAICRALLTQPALLLADEPTGNLDPDTTEQVLSLLLDTVKQHNTTLVMVTHDHSLLHHFDRTIDFAQFIRSPENAA